MRYKVCPGCHRKAISSLSPAVYCDCGELFVSCEPFSIDELTRQPQTKISVKSMKAPAWVVALQSQRTPEDRGVGDTFARLLGKFGEAFKATSKTLGIPCNCTRRQQEWNERWPY